jgi:hypothetical protein
LAPVCCLLAYFWPTVTAAKNKSGAPRLLAGPAVGIATPCTELCIHRGSATVKCSVRNQLQISRALLLLGTREAERTRHDALCELTCSLC